MESVDIDIKKILFKVLSYWYVFAFFLLLSLCGAYLYMEYTLPKYQASATLLIRDEQDSGQPLEEALFSELGLGARNKKLQDEQLILTSSPLMQEVVQNLNLNYWYTSVDGWKKRHLYKDSPLQVLSWEPAGETMDFSATVHIENMANYRLETEEAAYRGEFGKPLSMPAGKLMLSRNRDIVFPYPIQIDILEPGAMVEYCLAQLKVEPWDEKSSALTLSIKDFSANRAADILGELIDVYNRRSVQEKNQIYENTIGLINERLNLISQELTEAEKSLESYKKRFEMIELSAEGAQLLGELSTYDREISSTNVQLEILGSIESFLVENKDKFEFVPTNLSLNNLTLTNQLTSFNQLLAERSRQRNELGPVHPDLLLTEKQIQNLRETITENIRTIRRDLEIGRDASVNLKSHLSARMQSLPQREREMVEMERDKSIKENLYLYLMQKREESAISLSITVAAGKVVEPAVGWGPVSPMRSFIWLSAIFLGLVLPTGIVALVDFLNDKVQLQDDIERATSIPVVGMIGMSKKNSNIAVKENSRSAVAEMFRLLRANLAYLSPGKELQTILITSSTSGEGKSFIALNLGIVQAMAGKKVVILEMDLRKPKQEMYMKAEPTKRGVINYLLDPTIDLEQIIRKSEVHPNLDLVASGPKPPNPSELILSPVLRSLLEKLKERYNFIVIDAPPVGLVADALQMKDLAEATMYVVRYGVTRKGQLRIIEDIARKEKLPRPFIILNGVESMRRHSYGYNYGYGIWL